ncbi:MAG TPA: hypothetical protein VK162_15915 [Streptosporangiaceae bacterium]|nr:hypothetical protein [Streptosporangiaceae bacterium]
MTSAPESLANLIIDNRDFANPWILDSRATDDRLRATRLHEAAANP